jgi:hypothetical protein
MRSRDCSTRKEVSVLKSFVLRVFLALHQRQPSWTVEDLLSALSLPDTALLRRLAHQARFRSRREAASHGACRAASALLEGLRTPVSVSRAPAAGRHNAQASLQVAESSYGVAPFGSAPYGGSRKRSDGRTPVLRRVTSVGQLHYGGRAYVIGAAYRGQQVAVLEQGQDLVVTLADQRNVRLTRRH